MLNVYRVVHQASDSEIIIIPIFGSLKYIKLKDIVFEIVEIFRTTYKEGHDVVIRTLVFSSEKPPPPPLFSVHYLVNYFFENFDVSNSKFE